MISLGDAASLKDLPILLTVPFFTAAAMVDHILDTPRDVILALPMWWVRRVTQSDASLAEFFLGCFVLVGLVGAIVIVAIYMVVDLDQAVERIPVVGKHLAVLIWVAWTCITAGLFVVEVVIPGLPKSPLNPVWHLGLLSYGVGLIDWGAKLHERR
jgi:hypothetical protein